MEGWLNTSHDAHVHFNFECSPMTCLRLCVQSMGKPMRNDAKWQAVLQVFIDSVGDDVRKPYMRLTEVKKTAISKDKDADDEGGGAEPSSGKRTNDAPDVQEGKEYKMSRGGDLAYATSLVCRPAPDAKTSEDCMEKMLAFFECLRVGDACAVASHKTLPRDVRARHGQEFIEKFRAGKLQPFIALNSADWLEMFNRMLPTPGMAAFGPGSKQYSLDETLLVRFWCLVFSWRHV